MLCSASTLWCYLEMVSVVCALVVLELQSSVCQLLSQEICTFFVSFDTVSQGLLASDSDCSSRAQLKALVQDNILTPKPL